MSDELPKFAAFVRNLTSWVDHNAKLNQKVYAEPNHQLYQRDFSDVTKLWRAFLLKTLSGEITRYFRNNLSALDQLVSKISSLGGYAVKRHFIELLENSELTFLLDTRVDRYAEYLLSFHVSLRQWVDGTWHLKLKENPQTSLSELSMAYSFADKWQLAGLVSELGYPLPYSTAAYGAWNRYFHGEADSDGRYESWFNLLDSFSSQERPDINVDRFLDFVFSVNVFENKLLDCGILSSCSRCPVADTCVYLKHQKKRTTDHQLEYEARLGQLKQVPSSRLIRFIAGDRFTATAYQEHAIKEFPDVVELVKSASAGSNSEDEQFFIFLKCLKEISARESEIIELPTSASFSCSSDIVDYVTPILRDETQESFYTMILDNKHKMIRLQHITKGTLNQSLVHPREVFAPSVQLRAAAVILIHNHPSGDPTPSSQDIEITKRLIEVGNIIGIKVLDHVIIGEERSFSFVDEDVLF